MPCTGLNCPKPTSLETNNEYSYEKLTQTAEYLKSLISFTPQIGIICGSGLGSLADSIQQKIEVPYPQIPNFPQSTVKGHSGCLVFGYIATVPLVCMKGRFHYYEGYPLEKCAMPVRVMKLLGIELLIVTNAAGGLNPNYKVGDVMLIKDHVNLMGFAGCNPLRGPNEERFGPRFPSMNGAYDPRLRAEAQKIAQGAGLAKGVHEGVYACLGGPCYETIAENRLLRQLGVDTVGMSTVHEVIVAKHCGLPVFAFSLVTNESVCDYESKVEPKHDEVIDAAKSMEAVLQKFVQGIIEFVAKNGVK
ncbi:unnamed protein product [Phaedon cochleariae]|uniref:Purine nucleoside phosphorylase n=1 Tax=Phaedon cochleariae TaxID=80249 RepID=A0A9P0DZN8_PHACE|nr:unnamed protein product [Phaedon cochleariae]